MPLRTLIQQQQMTQPPPDDGDGREGAKPDETKTESYKLADFFVRTAKAELKEYQEQYKRNQKRRLGEDVYPLPRSKAAAQQSKNFNRSLRNYTFAMVDYLESLLTGTPPRIVAKARTTRPIPDLELKKVASAVQDQLESMNWLDFVADMVRDGMDGGVGYVMLVEDEDPVTGEYTMALELLDPEKCGADPRTNKLQKAHFFYIEEEMPMADIRQRFGDEIADQVEGYPAGQPDLATTPSDRRVRSESEIIAGANGQEFIQNSDGTMREHVARVVYVWIRDQATVTETKKALKLKDEQMELACPACGKMMARPENIDEPAPCPECGYDVASDPEVVGDVESIRPKYPYGRLLITAGKKCAYDGDNYEQIKQVFPIVGFMPYPENRRPIGASAVGLIRKSNATLNKNQNLAMAYVHSGAMGLFEYPKTATEYQKLPNNPQTHIGIDEDLCGIARKIDPANYNIEVHKIVDEDCKADMKFVLGVTGVSTGETPASPTSGREVYLRQRAGSTRTGRLQKRYSMTCTELAQLTWSVMRLRQTQPRVIRVPGVMGGMDEYQMFTPAEYEDIFDITVTCDPEQAERDENRGQNTVMLMEKGLLPPALDIALPALGYSYSEAEELARRKKQWDQEQLIAQSQGVVLPGMVPPAGAAPPPGRPAAAPSPGGR